MLVAVEDHVVICEVLNKGETKMIITTTNCIEGKEIVEYRGIVFGEVIEGVNALKDFVAGMSDFFGGRCETYEQELMRARSEALMEMQDRAYRLGADAVIGVKMDYEVLGTANSMLMVTCSGTAVILR